jgi:hypothetical protein
MYSFQPSRARILFEVLCAVGIAASCGGAWLQTGASALLAASAIATLYGLVHFFDLFRQEPSLAAEPQRIAFAADGQAQLMTVDDVVNPKPLVQDFEDDLSLDPRLSDFGQEETSPAEPVVVPFAEVVPAKAPRKGSKRATANQKKAKAAGTEQLAEPQVEDSKPEFVEEVTHTHVAPLFEADPFHRMPRQGFGRRGQI